MAEEKMDAAEKKLWMSFGTAQIRVTKTIEQGIWDSENIMIQVTINDKLSYDMEMSNDQFDELELACKARIGLLYHMLFQGSMLAHIRSSEGKCNIAVRCSVILSGMEAESKQTIKESLIELPHAINPHMSVAEYIACQAVAQGSLKLKKPNVDAHSPKFNYITSQFSSKKSCGIDGKENMLSTSCAPGVPLDKDVSGNGSMYTVPKIFIPNLSTRPAFSLDRDAKDRILPGSSTNRFIPLSGSLKPVEEEKSSSVTSAGSGTYVDVKLGSSRNSGEEGTARDRQQTELVGIVALAKEALERSQKLAEVLAKYESQESVKGAVETSEKSTETCSVTGGVTFSDSCTQVNAEEDLNLASAGTSTGNGEVQGQALCTKCSKALDSVGSLESDRKSRSSRRKHKKKKRKKRRKNSSSQDEDFTKDEVHSNDLADTQEYEEIDAQLSKDEDHNTVEEKRRKEEEDEAEELRKEEEMRMEQMRINARKLSAALASTEERKKTVVKQQVNSQKSQVTHTVVTPVGRGSHVDKQQLIVNNHGDWEKLKKANMRRSLPGIANNDVQAKGAVKRPVVVTQAGARAQVTSKAKNARSAVNIISKAARRSPRQQKKGPLQVDGPADSSGSSSDSSGSSSDSSGSSSESSYESSEGESSSSGSSSWRSSFGDSDDTSGDLTSSESSKSASQSSDIDDVSDEQSFQSGLTVDKTSTPIRENKFKRKIVRSRNQSPSAKRSRSHINRAASDVSGQELESDDNYPGDVEDDSAVALSASTIDVGNQSTNNYGQNSSSRYQVSGDEMPILDEEEKRMLKALVEEMDEKYLSRIRHMNFMSAAELKIKKKHTCFRGPMKEEDIIDMALVMLEYREVLVVYLDEMQTNSHLDTIVDSLSAKGYVYHLKYQKRIEDYIVKYMDLLDIRIGDVNPKRLKKMYNKVVNNLAEEIGTEALCVNVPNARLAPKKLRIFKTWFEYETITFLRVYYYVRIVVGLDRDRTFWTRVVSDMAKYGVFKTKDMCKTLEARMGVDAYAKRKKTNDQLSHADFLTRIVMVATKAFNKPAVGSIQEGVTAVTASGLMQRARRAIQTVKPTGSAQYISRVRQQGQPNAEQIVRPVAAVQPAIADPTLNANMLPIEHYLPKRRCRGDDLKEFLVNHGGKVENVAGIMALMRKDIREYIDFKKEVLGYGGKSGAKATGLGSCSCNCNKSKSGDAGKSPSNSKSPSPEKSKRSRTSQLNSNTKRSS